MGMYFVKDWFCKPSKKTYQGIWVPKTWNWDTGSRELLGRDIWTDGDNIYYYYYGTNYVLDRSTSTWKSGQITFYPKSPYNSFSAYNVWTDGENTYYSDYYNGTYPGQYIFDKTQNKFVSLSWQGESEIIGQRIWSNGENLCHNKNNGANTYIFDKSEMKWTYDSNLRPPQYSFSPAHVWTDGADTYYSDGSNHYVLDKATKRWNYKTWNGLTDFYGSSVWTDGTNIYYSNGSTQYILDKSTSTWSGKTWTGLTSFYGGSIWKDGDHIYSSSGSASTQYELT